MPIGNVNPDLYATEHAIPSPFVWDDSFDVTNGQINRQHQKLFAMIDDMIKNPADEARWGALVKYVVDHFATENEILSAKGQMDPVHSKQHGDFVALAGTVKLPIDKGTGDLLMRWLVHHIKNCDIQHYADIIDKNATCADKPDA